MMNKAIYYHSRTPSATSSSSAYSSNEPARDTDSETSASLTTKRFAIPSKGGADRRRLAIVQLDSTSAPPNRTQLLPPSDFATASIRERRGYKNELAGLALIAPPDAASHTYAHLTPPSTAPLTADMISRVVQHNTHQRSASDIARPTIDALKFRTWRLKNKNANDNTPTSTTSRPSTSPLFDYLSLNTSDFGSPIGTPEIGEPKDIHVPVAAPIVMNLDNVLQPRTTLSTPRAESPASSTVCGHGQSSMIIIDDHNTSDSITPRPSRLQSPALPPRDTDFGQGRQARAFGVAALRSAKMNVNDKSDSSVTQTNPIAHRREPATATREPDNLATSLDSHVTTKPSPNPKSDDLTLEEITPRPEGSPEPISPQYRVLPPTPVAKPPASSEQPSPSKLDHTKFDQWLKENPQYTTRDLRRGASLDEPLRYGPDRARSPLSADLLNVDQPPEPPLKGLRRSLTTKVKRFSSISRATSRSSKSTNRSSYETHRSRTPSPLPNHPTRSSPLNSHRVISTNPAALFCHEIGGQTTALQRCYIYANKINELSMYDCGLSNWIVQMNDQSLVPQRQRGPSSRSFMPQPRHTSRSSIISEATFPRRLDATTATDLSPGQFDDLSSPGLPQLPYPSLALRSIPPRSNTSSSSISPPTSLRSLTPSFSTSGFFAALGRKASLSKKDRTALSTRISSPGVTPNGARLPPVKASQPISARPIQITSPPTIPGGPRAPPSRSKRSQTYMSLVSPPSATASNGCDDVTARPPIHDNLPSDNVIDIKPGPEFTQQVDKLAALIPQADPNILAGYLRRAGSDMLAIGQYLEDERMGAIRSH